jgi:hypothetical protein
LTTRVIRKSRCLAHGHVGEALGDREAGVVDQDVDMATARRDGGQHGLVGVEHGQVGRHGEGLDAVFRGKLGGQGLQPVGPAGH